MIVGTRPEIIKMTPVIRALKKNRNATTLIVHSGQHYDFEMSQILFEELDLPSPEVNLKVGSGSHSQQTAKMFVHYEKIITKYQPDLVLAEGDTNTVVAAGLASIKLHAPFGHVEAGLRCHDRTMPEEINRIVADDCAELRFAPSRWAALNLLYEGIPPHTIYVTGNPIVDQCLHVRSFLEKRSNIIEELKLDEYPFLLVTVHRAETVDVKEMAEGIVRSLLRMKDLQFVFPIHPRTKTMFSRHGLLSLLQKADHIKLTPPLGYYDFMNLMLHSEIVLTDSGGVQEEALTLGKPCITLRYNTERPETVWAGGNFLVGTDEDRLVFQVREILSDKNFLDRLKMLRNPYGDGHAGERIASICIKECKANLAILPSTYTNGGSATYTIHEIPERFSGISVEEFLKKNPGLHISLIYDRNGSPLLPKADMNLERGWRVRVFGEAGLPDPFREESYVYMEK